MGPDSRKITIKSINEIWRNEELILDNEKKKYEHITKDYDHANNICKLL